MVNETSVPSFAVVSETCLAACKCMKGISKQLMLLSGSYKKGEFVSSSADIYDCLSQIMQSVKKMQESLETAGKSMNVEICELEKHSFPDTFMVTAKEYVFLNKVMAEYTDIITSKPFSLFSSHHINLPCPDNADKSKTN